MSYSLTSAVEKILETAYVEDVNTAILKGNSTEGQTFGNSSHITTKQRFVVFSYHRDFEFLWGLHQDGGLKDVVDNVITASYKHNLKKASEYIVNELTLVVVWDGIPDSDGSPMNIGGYVTPFDWAVMFSCCLFRAAIGSLNKDKPKPKVRILILDLKSHEYGTSFGVKAFQALHGQFPWIQIYRPIGKDSLKSVAITRGDEFTHTRAALPLDAFGFEDFIEDLLHTDRILFTYHEDDDADRQNYLEIAVGLWGNHLVKPGDRHTVANMIGPLMLACGFSNKHQRDRIVKAITEDSPLRNALAELVYTTGLASREIAQGGSTAGILQAGKPGRLGRGNNLKFILIDDQYASGFHHILASLIFGDKYTPTEALPKTERWESSFPSCGSIQCYCQAEALLKILLQLQAITNWDMPKKLNLPDNGDILLLDLRMWTEDDQKQKFFDTLIKVCAKLNVNSLCSKDSSFKQAFEAVNGKNPNETYALVLLPLLLSHYDPSLPIVLFSSTHQRAVIEMVAHRPNIITDFSKPLLGNYVQITEAGDFLKDLRVALENAIQLHEARIIWERIVNLNTVAPEFYIKKEINNHKVEYFFNQSSSRGNQMNYPLTAEEIQKQLGYYFQHYILQAVYFDFVSIPWEFIEGSFLIANPDGKGRFDVTDTGGIFLKKLRHKKAHGYLTDLLGTLHLNYENWRCLSILEFLVFIDFLEQAKVELDSPCNNPQNLFKAKDADVNGNILEYSLNLICAIWGKKSHSFSQITKDIVLALRHDA